MARQIIGNKIIGSKRDLHYLKPRILLRAAVRARAHYEKSLSLAEQIHHDVLMPLSFEMDESTRKVVIHNLHVPPAYFHAQRQDNQAVGRQWRRIIPWQLFPRRLPANLAGEPLFSSRCYLADRE